MSDLPSLLGPALLPGLGRLCKPARIALAAALLFGCSPLGPSARPSAPDQAVTLRVGPRPPARGRGPAPIFDGVSLAGWEGEPGWWRVEDGAIVAESTAARPRERTTYLVWRGGLVDDFELTLSVRLQNGNTGIQLRSRELPGFLVEGYQADLDTLHQWTGGLYEHGSGLLAARGESVVLDQAGKRHVTSIGDPALLAEAVGHNDWYEYRIVARGERIELFLDGVLMSRTEDRRRDAPRRGVLALQLHAGGASRVEFKDIALALLDDDPPVVPNWIWGPESRQPEATMHFRRSFRVDGPPTRAELVATGDNLLELFLDGEPVAESHDWTRPVFVDVSEQLSDGWRAAAGKGQWSQHELAARVVNEGGPAGLLLELRVSGPGVTPTTVVSNSTWLSAASVEEGWQELSGPAPGWASAADLAPLGGGAWTSLDRDSFDAGARQADPQATAVDRITVPPGFVVELLYSSLPWQGSWVAMCVDDVGRLIVSDQYDRGLWRITLPEAGHPDAPPTVEAVDVDLSGAQGLLWAHDSLYVSVSSGGRHESGIYRLRDTDGDDALDQVEQLAALEGSGEHGWHSLVLDPDGRSIIVVAGNMTIMPELSSSRVPLVWGEDLLLPRLTDPSDFMASYLAPAGCIYRIDPDAREWELLSNGYRNPYDAAFNRHGDLFTFDADMEWDLNTPWYRPTRVCLVSSGSEYGWRTGSGKWPRHHADSLPPVAEIGTGSPVGIVFGHETHFPAPWNEVLFLADWSYGRVFALQLSPDGGSYQGRSELFMSGTPLPTTDMVVRPQDGALYFITGGRNVQTGLYRLRWEGATGDAPPPGQAADPARAASDDSLRASSDELHALRRRMESWHGRSDPGAVDAIWPTLGHPDRFVRYAARVALEWQPPAGWRDRALAEQHPRRSLAALMALARTTARDLPHRPEDAPEPDAGLAVELLTALERLEWDELPLSLQLELLRVHTLVFTRLGAPPESVRAALVDRFGSRFPSGSPELDGALCELLVFLQAPGLAARAVPRLTSAPTQEEQLDLARSLRRLTVGWTEPLARAFGRWLQRAQGYGGGNSFAGFVRRVRDDALEHLPETMTSALQQGSTDELAATQAASEAGAPPAISPFFGRTTLYDWRVSELLPKVTAALGEADLSRGRDLFAAASCFTCHRVGSEGGAVGPDLTGAGGRFSLRDLLIASIEPSETVSDQYKRALLVLSDGSLVSGQIANLHGGTVDVIPDMSRPSVVVNVQEARIERIERSSVSPMPEGLLAPLTEDEIVDLMAWILSAHGS